MLAQASAFLDMRYLRKLAGIIVLFATLFSSAAYSSDTPGQFDFYVLNLSWEPQFCASSRHKSGMEECQKPDQGFVVHGLWPQYNQGYPQSCSHSRGPENAEAYLDMMPSTWLVEHEWKTHGTCSGLSAENYFTTMRKAYESLVIPNNFKHVKRGFALTPKAVKQAFLQANPTLEPENIAVSCGNNYLTAVSVCFSKDTLAPHACTGLRDCRANSIRITGSN